MQLSPRCSPQPVPVSYSFVLVHLLLYSFLCTHVFSGFHSDILLVIFFYPILLGISVQVKHSAQWYCSCRFVALTPTTVPCSSTPCSLGPCPARGPTRAMCCTPAWRVPVTQRKTTSTASSLHESKIYIPLLTQQLCHCVLFADFMSQVSSSLQKGVKVLCSVNQFSSADHLVCVCK